MLKGYRNERRKRRNAIRMIFQNRNSISFSDFLSGIQAMGFQESSESLFRLYREAQMIGFGTVGIEPILTAMDNLHFHFRSIEFRFELFQGAQISEIGEKALIENWLRVERWFSRYIRMNSFWLNFFDHRISLSSKKTVQLFKGVLDPKEQFYLFHQLLDFFQFSLSVYASEQKVPFAENKTERAFQLLENIIDILMTIVSNYHGEVNLFTTND